MSNFTLPGSYDGLEKTPPSEQFPRGEFTLELDKVKSYFPTVTVPVGTVMYRGDKGGAQSPASELPAFFGNRNSVGIYAAKNEKNVSSYRIKKALMLLELNLNSVYALQMALIAHMPPEFLGKDEKKRSLLKQLILMWSDPDSGIMKPSVPIGPKRASGHIPYLNRLMADIVCRLGFDGWIVFPYDPAKRQGLTQMSIIHGEVAYPPEIMVCAWTNHMERIVGGGRRKTHNRRRAICRKTAKSKRSYH